MIDIIKTNIFPSNVVSGVATGNSYKYSYFKTKSFKEKLVNNSRKELEKLNSIYFKHFLYQNQKHSDFILNCNDNWSINEIQSDAIICQKKGILINISIADCQALLIYDPKTNSIGAIHSGWKGTYKKIVTKTIARLKSDFNTHAEDLLVFLSPSASFLKYEVGNEFISIFPNNTKLINGKYYFDNRNEIMNQLLLSGVLPNNIESSDDCTITNNRYHSYRRDKQQSGRMSAFIGIKEH